MALTDSAELERLPRINGPFIPDLLEQVGLDRHYNGDDLDDLLQAYEDAYENAYWAEVQRSALAIYNA